MSPAQALEHRTMGITSKDRIGRLEEGVALLRRLFTEERVTHEGRFYQVEGVTIEPRPVQRPLPIWIASNPTTVTYKVGQTVDRRNVERSFRRVARLADGWMTNKIPPAVFAEQWAIVREMAAEEGRDPNALGNVLYHNININPDRAAGPRGKHAVSQSILHRQFHAGVRGGVDDDGHAGAVHRGVRSVFRRGGPGDFAAPDVLEPAASSSNCFSARWRRRLRVTARPRGRTGSRAGGERGTEHHNSGRR